MRGPTAGCFGKLPFFGDFLRHNLPGADVEELDRWFREGMYLARSTWGPSWEQSFDAAPPSRFVLGASPCLVGVMAPGRDSSGRRFPFAVFVALDLRVLDDAVALVPRACSDFLDEAERLVNGRWLEKDLRGLAGRLDGLAVDLDRLEETREQDRSGLETRRASSLFGGATGAALVAHLRDLLAAVPPGKLNRLGYGVKLPIGTRGPEALPGCGVSFWLQAASQLKGLEAVPSLAFWREQPPAGSLFLLFGKPAAGHFLHWVQPEMQTDAFYDVLAGAQGAAGSSREESDPTLAELLGRIGS